MNDSQTRDVFEAVLISMTEEEMANWRREQGAHVVCHRGRYWEEKHPGFYQPIHWLARLSAEQSTSPARLCWGFRAVLCEDEVATANGSIPLHLLSNLQDYDLQNFSSNRRHNIRRCQKRVKIVELISPVPLQAQGYEVLLSTMTRIGHGKLPSRKDYLASLAKYYVVPGRWLVLAGFIGDKLGGYITGYAVGGTAYFDRLYITTEVLTTNISAGLYFEFVQICRRSKEIREVVIGLHIPENPAMGVFKEGIGFPVKHVPTKVQMNPIIGKFIRWRRPYTYYRLTGHH